MCVCVCVCVCVAEDLPVNVMVRKLHACSKFLQACVLACTHVAGNESCVDICLVCFGGMVHCILQDPWEGCLALGFVQKLWQLIAGDQLRQVI